MTENFEDYRAVLKFEFEVRHGRNSAYTLNAFARDLALSSSRLSEILSGKQGLSSTRAKIVGDKIGYRNAKLRWFCNLVEAESGRSLRVRTLATKRLRRYRNGVLTRAVEPQSPIQITWLHLAIRRLTSLKNFKSDPKWIAARLKEPVGAVDLAIEGMLRVGLLTEDDQKTLKISESIHLPAGSMNEEAQARYCEEMLAKALESRRLPRDYRRMGIHFFTIDRGQMPELIEIIQEFEDRIDNLTSKTLDHDMLMSSVGAIFPMSHDEPQDVD